MILYKISKEGRIEYIFENIIMTIVLFNILYLFNPDRSLNWYCNSIENTDSICEEGLSYWYNYDELL